MIKLVWFCLSVFDEFLFSNRLRFFVKKQHSQPRAKPGRGEKQNDTLLLCRDTALQLGNGIMLDYRPLIFRSFSSEKFIKMSRWILLLFPAVSITQALPNDCFQKQVDTIDSDGFITVK